MNGRTVPNPDPTHPDDPFPVPTASQPDPPPRPPDDPWTPPPPAEVAAVLRAAEQVLAARGWCQCAHVDGDGRVCLLGAIDTALASDPDAADRLDDAQRCLREQVVAQLRAELHTEAGTPRWLTVWNDMPGRTAAEVKQLLHRTAERLEAAA
jgi:hypothetical protein